MVITISPAAAASAIVAAARPPCVRRVSALPATISKPVTWWPALARFAAIGAPILPSPIKPIVAIVGILRSAASGEAELAVADRCKIRIDHIVAHFGERGRLPARRLVLVDQRPSHAFVKVAPRHDMLSHPVFEGECRFEIVIAPDRQLAQGEFEAGRRFCRQTGLRLRGPPGIRAAGCRLCRERGENRLDVVAGEAPVDYRPQCLERRGPWLLRKTGECRINQAAAVRGPRGSAAKLLD